MEKTKGRKKIIQITSCFKRDKIYFFIIKEVNTSVYISYLNIYRYTANVYILVGLQVVFNIEKLINTIYAPITIVNLSRYTGT
jgi:hypothetical protein